MLDGRPEWAEIVACYTCSVDPSRRAEHEQHLFHGLHADRRHERRALPAMAPGLAGLAVGLALGLALGRRAG